MSLSVDLDNRRVTAAVGDLSGEGSGRVIGLGGSGLSRLWLGQELHRRKQEELLSSDSGFRSEVQVGTEIEIDGWQVSLVGRADGVLFDDETPLALIEKVQPDILVKGGDWPIETIVGREVVEAKGGKVLSIPLVEGLSTTDIISRVAKLPEVKAS
ncbi:MAG: hypothetical protein C0609_09215 [Deltaproteobacteria bacterium]|nr:MAG: hypothetical protein C0609_09215 [Deltaproteobacteria bacterium]